MKLPILTVVLVCALASCGGKNASTSAPEAPPTPCASAAAHMSEVLRAELGDALAAEDWPKVTAVLDERCTADQWDATTVSCMQAAAQGPDFDNCADQLPDEHEAAVKAQFEKEIKPLMNEDAMQKKEASDGRSAPSGGAPPPSDPCGGGE